jgi:hypothetical protein
MCNKRINRSRQLLLIAVVVSGAFTCRPDTALSAPGPTYLYVEPETNRCGELWVGDEYTDHRPQDPKFVALWSKPSTDRNRCSNALALFDRAELEHRLKANNVAQPDPAEDPCGTLALALKAGLPLQGKYRGVCEALGYAYIGKVPTIATDLKPHSTDSGNCGVSPRGRQRSVGSRSLVALLISLFAGPR